MMFLFAAGRPQVSACHVAANNRRGTDNKWGSSQTGCAVLVKERR
jgi:hypothetical protein